MVLSRLVHTLRSRLEASARVTGTTSSLPGLPIVGQGHSRAGIAYRRLVPNLAPVPPMPLGCDLHLDRIVNAFLQAADGLLRLLKRKHAGD